MAQFNNILLDNDTSINPINLSFIDDNQIPKKSTKNSMSSAEHFIDSKFTKLNDIRKDLNLGQQNNIFLYERLIGIYKEEIENFKGEIYFLRQQMKEKDNDLATMISLKNRDLTKKKNLVSK